MKLRAILAVVVVTVALCACRRQDILTFEISVPGMTNEVVARRAMSAVAQELKIPDRQVMGIKANTSAGTLTLTYSVTTIPPDKKVLPRHKRQIHADMSRHVLTVTYDSMKTARKNIEFAIANSGLAANEVLANPMEIEKDAPPKPMLIAKDVPPKPAETAKDVPPKPEAP